MESHARYMTHMTIARWLPILDGKFAQGGLVIAAFATAAVLAALYGPGPREAAALQQTVLPTATAAAAGAPRVELDPNADEAAAREIARRKIAEALYRQAAEAAALSPAVSVEPVAPQSQAASAAPAAPATPAPAAPSFNGKDFEKLANKAAGAIRAGDIAGARLVLEHAILAGDTTAIYALAETYDPRILAQLHVRGMQADPDKARALYQQALAKGVTQAQEKLAPSNQ